MNSNKKFVIILEIFVITILVMSVVTVCGLSDSSPDISASPSIVNPGDEIIVTYSGAPGFYWDYIAIYKVGEQDIYEQCELGGVIHLLEGKKSGTLTFTAPDEPGDYEFRLFEGGGDIDIARSNIVTVQEGTTVSTPTPTPTPTTPSGVHRLGDNTLSDWEVPKPEGTEYTTTFSLAAVPASADLTLDVFQIDHNDPVLVNGKSVGILCKNPIKSWKPCTIKIPGSALQVGSNTLTIQSESRGGNYDDFMIRNIEVTPSSDAKPSPTPIDGEDTQWASDATASSEYSSTGWSAKQTTGAPNTATCGDIRTAWAPKSSGSDPEWLKLTFDTPVHATKLRVHETHNAGFIYRVDLVDINGGTHTIWEGSDTTSCPGWFEITFSQTTYLVRGVILHTRINGWEEIDAVQLVAGAEEVTPTPTTLSGAHHLGDQTMSDWEVPKPEGTEYTTTFSLTAVPASADLTLDVFQIDHNDPVLVNGNSVGILCINTIKSWKQCTIEIPGSALRVGSNTLTIQSESRGGNYDDFMIRNIEVTPSSDAKPITPPPTTDAELVAYYPFDGDIRDYSGNGNDGTIHGATFVSGISGQALSFDGKDDYVQVPDSPSLDIASNNIALSAWVYFPEFVPDYGTVIEKTGSGGWNSYGVFSKSDKLSFWLYTESIEAHTAVSANQWVHFVATYDGINMKIYINGALDVEREQPGIDINENDMPLMIGADPFGGGDYGRILIDEVKIYNCALSADEIKALYEEKEPSAPIPTPPPIDSEEAPVTVLTSSTILPTAGGLLTVESEDNELNGASLDIPARALTDNVMMSIATTGDLPSDSPFGQVPVGKLFVLVPSDLTFSVPVTLTLPIPAGEERQGLYIGRWDEKDKIWENIGGTIDGDFIATNISHLSFYGVFYSGKSTVQIVNKQDLDITDLRIAAMYESKLDTSDLSITVMYVAGPVPPQNTPTQSPFRATRPLPPGGVKLKQGESRIMELLPGRYHFVVSYPRPQPGVANSMWFTITNLTSAQGADDGQVDQTITITDSGAVSTDPFTGGSLQFPGRTIVGTTNFRPVINVGAIVPAGVPRTIVPVNPAQIPPLVNVLETGTNQILNIGPIKVEQLQDEGITLSATVTDPQGSALKFYWNVLGDPLTGLRRVDLGTTASGSTITHEFSRSRAGVYTVYLTVYNQFGLFNEGRWVILVSPNAKPYIDVVVDDVVIDFGRLDDKRRNIGVGSAPGLPRNHPIPFPNVNFLLSPAIPNWGVYSATALPPPPTSPFQITGSSSTDLKRLPILPLSDQTHIDPTQYPCGMTCVFAIVADADGDSIESGFILPTPLFGRGNMYTAIPIPNATNPITSEIKLSDGKTLAKSFPDGYPIGAILDNYKVMEAYNAVLTEYANRGWLPVQPHIGSPFVAPIESLRTPPREFPYVIGFNQGIRNGPINPGDTVRGALNPLGLIPQGTVFKVIVVEGSWTDGDARGYLWLIPVTNNFWDPRNSPLVPRLFVNGIRKATCSYVGQTLPVIWEAPDDPDVEQTTHDRRHVFDPSTIIPRGGTVNIEARVKDPFSPQERAFGLVAWPTAVDEIEEGEEEEDTSHCDKFQDQYKRDDCYYNAAIEKKDPSICAKIECPYHRDMCYDAFGQNEP